MPVETADWPWENQVQEFVLEDTLDLSFQSQTDVADTTETFNELVPQSVLEFDENGFSTSLFPPLRGRLSNAYETPVEPMAPSRELSAPPSCPVCSSEISCDDDYSEHVHACFFEHAAVGKKRSLSRVSQQKEDIMTRDMIYRLRNTIASIGLTQRINLQESLARLARGASRTEEDAKTLLLLFTQSTPVSRKPKSGPTAPLNSVFPTHLNGTPFSHSLVHQGHPMQRSLSAPSNISTSFVSNPPLPYPIQQVVTLPVPQTVFPPPNVPNSQPYCGTENLKVDINAFEELDGLQKPDLFSDCTTPVTFPVGGNSPPNFPELDSPFVNLYTQSVPTPTIRNLKRQRDQGDIVPIVQALPFSPRASKLVCL
mmetsp:Transcript_27342/g.38677  ORF Transcript_27342/g.38677 Transcript_27342/m.38677 type:complete len:369 (-) Transcript_27342:90-1196(-)